jgi:hypothetical protein
MNRLGFLIAGFVCALLVVQSGECQSSTAGLGMFAGQSDVGTVLHPGSASFDASRGSYSLTASGENVWGTADAFYFVWKKFSGDAALTADIAFPTTTGNPHKKAMLMIRQSLDADSPYVDAALHLAGLTSLQWRAEKGGATHEVGTDAASPTRLRLEKHGSDFFLYWARAGEDLHFGGGSMRPTLTEPFYIGLGLSAHDRDAIETAVFSNVSIEPPSRGKPKLHSTLETISVSSTDRRVVAVFDKRIEAPSWTPDGSSLLFKEGKHIEKIPAAGGKIETVTGSPALSKAAGEQPSPDGQRVAFWSQDADATTLNVKTVSDGKVKVLAKLLEGPRPQSAPSWSPDGKRLVFVSYQLVP